LEPEGVTLRIGGGLSDSSGVPACSGRVGGGDRDLGEGDQGGGVRLTPTPRRGGWSGTPPLPEPLDAFFVHFAFVLECF